MVLRVDVVEAALRAATAPIRRSSRPARRRADPGGRVLDDAYVAELARRAA